MILIELVFEPDCPKAARARANLAMACLEARVSQRWTEWILSNELCPARVRGVPTPAILINGREVTSLLPLDASHSCADVPPVEMIATALAAAKSADPDVPEAFLSNNR